MKMTGYLFTSLEIKHCNVQKMQIANSVVANFATTVKPTENSKNNG